MSNLKIIHDKLEARQWVRSQTQSGRSVGLVPTMGALHAGHFSLVDQSVRKCDATIATIFVNPTQFAAGEDLDQYPRTLAEDLAGLRDHHADAVFVPEANTMYRPDHSTYVLPGNVAKGWEGTMRPEHFRGVATVVLKLFNILPATHAYFGQKDYQQVAVIQSMVHDLDIEINIQVAPIVREPDGLAMSSRNRYLSDEERIRAGGISGALRHVEQKFREGERDARLLEQCMTKHLHEHGLNHIDYAAIADALTLDSIERIERDAVALIAVRVGKTRLIDNLVLHP